MPFGMPKKRMRRPVNFTILFSGNRNKNNAPLIGIESKNEFLKKLDRKVKNGYDYMDIELLNENFKEYEQHEFIFDEKEFLAYIENDDKEPYELELNLWNNYVVIDNLKKKYAEFFNFADMYMYCMELFD